MEVHTALRNLDLRDVPAAVQRVEALGFDGVNFGDREHDVFLQVAIAIEHTKRIKVGTSIALSFVRSPMVTAYMAWDLQKFSDGRFELGLGTQVKGHNERRFSVPWYAPAARMREYGQALKTIWDCYQNGTPLDYQGKHYAFTLMNAEFNPGPIEYPNPPIYLAAVGPLMSRVAGEAYDGLLAHGLTSRQYRQEVTLPQLKEGARRARRTDQEFLVAGAGFIATGATDEEVHRAREWVRFRVGWYSSTLSYKPVLDTHGWGDLSLPLHKLVVANEWDKLPGLVTDDMLDTFCTSGTYDEIVPKLKERCGSEVARIAIAMPDDRRMDDRLGAALEKFREI